MNSCVTDRALLQTGPCKGWYKVYAIHRPLLWRLCRSSSWVKTHLWVTGDTVREGTLDNPALSPCPVVCVLQDPDAELQRGGLAGVELCWHFSCIMTLFLQSRAEPVQPEVKPNVWFSFIKTQIEAVSLWDSSLSNSLGWSVVFCLDWARTMSVWVLW